MIQKVLKLAKMYLRLKSFSKWDYKKIHAEQFSEEEKLLKFTDIATKSHWVPWKRLLRCWMYRKQLVTIYNSGCCGMAGSLDMKRTLWNQYANGWRTLFPKIRATDPNNNCSSWHELSPPDFDGGTKALHPVSIKELFKKITRLNLGFELKETSFKFYYLLFWRFKLWFWLLCLKNHFLCIKKIKK
jgi:hypothetical protein